MSIITINPATSQPIKSYPLMNRGELDTLLHKAGKTQAIWKKTALNSRKEKMLKVANLLTARVDTLALLITAEMGKPITQARAEILKCVHLCHYYIDHADAFLAPTYIDTEMTKSKRCYEPLGVIFAIMPWNFPFWQVMRFAVPNLLAGNAGVLKHAPNSTGAAIAIEAIFLEAGFPEHLFSSVIIDVDLAPFIIHHPVIQGVTLTGSHRAGEVVGAEAAKACKKVVLELGGSDPYVVLEDADLELAADECIKSRLNNTGQVCIAAKRIIVVDAIKADVQALLLKRISSYDCGDPTLAATTLGPMAREDLRDHLTKQVHQSIKKGATCLLGGEPKQGSGFFYPATFLTDIPREAPAYSDELFGPVVCLFSVKNEKEAIQMANDTPFGLGGAVFTKDIVKGERIATNEIHAGTCNVNTLVASDPRLPFGGIKQSGHGRELAKEGMHEFMNIKAVSIR